VGEGSSIINEACPLVHPSFFLRSTTCNTTTMPKNVCRRATLLLPTQPLRPLTTHHIQAYETHRENGSKRLLARVPRSSSSKISNGGSPLMLLPGRAKKKQQANRIGKTRAGGLVSLFSSPLDRGVGGEEGKQTLALWVLSALRPAATHPPQPIIPLACVFTGLDDTIAGTPSSSHPNPGATLHLHHPQRLTYPAKQQLGGPATPRHLTTRRTLAAVILSLLPHHHHHHTRTMRLLVLGLVSLGVTGFAHTHPRLLKTPGAGLQGKESIDPP